MEQKNTWLVKICCAIAAFSLWLYIVNVDNNQVSQRVTIPVTPINADSVTDKKLVILPNQKLEVTLNVKGTPTDVQLKKNDFKVVADMSMYALSKGEIRIPIIIERQPVNVTVLNTQNYYVKVAFDDLIQKTVSVKLSLDGKIKDGYYALSETINPTEVTVSGAAKYVNQVTAVEAKGDLSNSSDDLNLALPLTAVDSDGKEIKYVYMDSDKVSVTVPIKKTKTVGINIKTKGKLKENLILKSLTCVPEKVDIAGDSIINSITSLDTEPVDLSTIASGKNIVVKVKVPDGVDLINSNGMVRIKADLEKVVKKDYSLNIDVKNLNDSYSQTLDNSKLTLTVSGSESVINTVSSTDFKCYVDLKDINSEGEHSVKVNIDMPQGVTKVSSTLDTVKVTLKKKDDQTPAQPEEQPATTPDSAEKGGQ